jgi:hypothetical protein
MTRVTHGDHPHGLDLDIKDRGLEHFSFILSGTDQRGERRYGSELSELRRIIDAAVTLGLPFAVDPRALVTDKGVFHGAVVSVYRRPSDDELRAEHEERLLAATPSEPHVDVAGDPGNILDDICVFDGDELVPLRRGGKHDRLARLFEGEGGQDRSARLDQGLEAGESPLVAGDPAPPSDRDELAVGHVPAPPAGEPVAGSSVGVGSGAVGPVAPRPSAPESARDIDAIVNEVLDRIGRRARAW